MSMSVGAMNTFLLLQIALLASLSHSTSGFISTSSIGRRRLHVAPSLSPSSLAFGKSGVAKIPASSKDRDGRAIDAIKASIKKPKNLSVPLLECEFPALQALNKLGDGSLRSAREAEEVNDKHRSRFNVFQSFY
jgi:hypothetical protein